MPQDDPIEQTLLWFSRIYLGGIPPIITDDSAFLSFICVLTAVEALAGYRYSNNNKKGERFKQFILDYFPPDYAALRNDLWKFRNSVIHAFSPARFALTHHHSERHFQSDSNNVLTLNAEDFYGALLTAAQKYIAQVRIDAALRELLLARLKSSDGGGISVGPINLSATPTQT